MMEKVIAFVAAIAGSTMLGLHFGSPWVGIGVYLCIVACANWK